jgi:hypothetical protein
MPDGSQGVKDTTPNLHPGSAGARRIGRPNPRPDGPHSGQVKVQIVDRVQNLRQQFVRGVKMAQIGP